jgi:hypothetical protein
MAEPLLEVNESFGFSAAFLVPKEILGLRSAGKCVKVVLMQKPN